MMSERSGNDTEQQPDRSSIPAQSWVLWLSRFGYFAKAFVYIIIGILAVQAAWGSRLATISSRDALHALESFLGQPLGLVILGLLAVGLAGYALWRFVQAFIDPEHKGSDAKGIAKRVGYTASGLGYATLAWTAAQFVFGVGTQGDGHSQEDWTAWFLSLPLGQWLIAAGGLLLAGIGLNAFYIAYEEKFRKKLALEEMQPSFRDWAVRIGSIGLAARGLIFVVLGIFLIQAALQADPNEAGGLGEAFKTLAEQPLGAWILGGTALGFIAYGIYELIEARYRRIFAE